MFVLLTFLHNINAPETLLKNIYVYNAEVYILPMPILMVTAVIGRPQGKAMWSTSIHCMVNWKCRNVYNLQKKNVSNFFKKNLVKHKTSAPWKCFLWKMFSLYQLFVGERFLWILVCFMTCYLHDGRLRTCFPLSLYCTVKGEWNTHLRAVIYSAELSSTPGHYVLQTRPQNISKPYKFIPWKWLYLIVYAKHKG